MRLWHSKLIPFLDGKRLCDLHMSCCNLRGKGWGKPNKSINYLYSDPLGEDALARYHEIVLYEMARRGYKFDPLWMDPTYCGKNRPQRSLHIRNLEEATRRNVPLEGHTLEIYLNDIATLKERGIFVAVTCSNEQDLKIFYAVCNGRSTQYVLKEGKQP